MTESQKKHRLFLLDILRILCALQIYMYHSGTMYGCTYGHAMDGLLRYLTSPVMTCFFILSGFSIHYQHMAEETTRSWTRTYLKKRLISIMPSYLLVAVIWPIVYPAQMKDWIILLPIDLFGIQTSYRTLFGILHNGGTWFVSCMLLCYVCYPVIKSVMSSEKRETSIIAIVITHFLLMYSNVVIPAFSLDSLYSNPIARAAEFMIGVGYAEIVFSEDRKKERRRILCLEMGGCQPIWVVIVLTFFSFVIAVCNHADLKVLIFGYFVVPIILMVLYISNIIRSTYLENNRILSMLSGMSYQFFLAQLFLWNLTSKILTILHMNGNIIKIVISFILCLFISFVTWKFYDKPVRKVLNKKLLI